jgi:hypothetical protein
VTWDRHYKKWKAQIWANGSNHNVGLFTSPIDAALAYNSAAIKYHGEFAKLNEADTGC